VLAGVTRFSWRYTSLKEVERIAGVMGGIGLVMLSVRYGHPFFPVALNWVALLSFPASVILIDVSLAFLLLSAVRALSRSYVERGLRSRHAEPTSRIELKPTILIGAGKAGVLIARELEGRPDQGLRPVAFLDDDAGKHGSLIHGLPVLGCVADIEDVSERTAAKEVLITIASLSRDETRAIFERCHAAGLHVKTIPPIYEIAAGLINVSQIRDVSIEDILGREPVKLDEAKVAASIAGKVVLVTGAGGSIGSELCRQLVRFHPSNLVLVERFENNLFCIHKELREKFTAQQVEPCLADITDRARMETVLSLHKPAIIFHAAAHKHVPMMEWNPGEAVKNNVFGTKLMADLAHEHKVEAFVMISTDKAVKPANVMGATKRAAEMYIQALAATSSTRIMAVRFGNVLGSAGSVVPIFREQIAQGGPVTVTHPDMERYFMTIPEACQLVLQAEALGEGGEVFILDMGRPVKIVDLARQMIRLSGFEPDTSIKIQFSGIRPGEKLFEELRMDHETMNRTKHEKVFVSTAPVKTMSEIMPKLALLTEALESPDGNIRMALKAVVHEFSQTGIAPAVQPCCPSPPITRPPRSSPKTNWGSSQTPAI
jgi:FlaA1/EpsC-like NDP-sugar epimerase